MSGTTVYFNFTYDATEQQYGCLDVNGDFIPFNSGGGIDTNDATAYAKNIELGYTAYARGEKIVGTANVSHSIAKYTDSTISLSTSRNTMGAATVGNHALFAGGNDSSGRGLTTVDAYDTNLTRSLATNLQTQRYQIVGCSTTDYAIFGGGYDMYGYNPNVVVYDTSLTMTQLNYTLDSRYSSSTSIGEYALFNGIYDTSGSGYGYTEAINSSLSKSTQGIGNGTRVFDNAAASNNNYGIFAGGMYYYDSSMQNVTVVNYVHAYNTSLIRTQKQLTEARFNLGGASTGDYVLFAGGGYREFYQGATTTYKNTVEAFNNSLTSSSPVQLSTAKYMLQGTNTGDYAIFGGGNPGATIVDVYDNSLAKSLPDEFSISRSSGFTATHIGDYALFGGGGYNYNFKNLEVYYIN